jgi:hypothetical protein
MHIRFRWIVTLGNSNNTRLRIASGSVVHTLALMAPGVLWFMLVCV